MAELSVDWAKEMGGADLGDARRSERLAKLVGLLAANPAKTLPEAMETPAALEAAYRFLSNDAVEAADVLQPHVESTLNRARAERTVVVAHDTTEFSFNGTREDMGRLRKNPGFLAHVALVLSDDGRARPLGVADLQTWTRPAEIRGAVHPRKRAHLPDNENRRWAEQALKVGNLLREAGCRSVHVMDREADSYSLFDAMLQNDHRFVVRAKSDRVIHGEDAARKMSELLGSQPIVATREVQLSSRPPAKQPKGRKKHPPRETRQAMLEFRGASVLIKRPSHYYDDLPETLLVNVVEVIEPNPPEGVAPVRWTLVTNSPIDTPDELLLVVDHYRCRWRIEEYFKALKTGCIFEKRQLESLHGLRNLLAVSAPIAWQLLRLRSVSQQTPDAPASTAIEPALLRVLTAIPRARLPEHPTARDVMLSVAALGGHIKNNGDPGWQVLGRGFARLSTMAEGWNLAHKM